MNRLRKARRPRLVYASASGYGPDGPYAEKPGQDLLAPALFGMMAISLMQTALDLQPRDIDAGSIQRELVRQGAYLSPSVEEGLETGPGRRIGLR